MESGRGRQFSPWLTLLRPAMGWLRVQELRKMGSENWK
jgi:hypothetical protein